MNDKTLITPENLINCIDECDDPCALKNGIGRPEHIRGNYICPNYTTAINQIFGMNEDELADFFAKYFEDDFDAPWDNWINKKYCNNCPPVLINDRPYAQCEPLYDADEEDIEEKTTGTCPYNIANLTEKEIILKWLRECEDIL